VKHDPVQIIIARNAAQSWRLKPNGHCGIFLMMKPVTLLLMSVLLPLPVAAATGSDSDRIYTHRAVDGDTLTASNRFLIRKTEWQLLQKHNHRQSKPHPGRHQHSHSGVPDAHRAGIVTVEQHAAGRSSAGTTAKGQL
jgi:hypothetical protein